MDSNVHLSTNKFSDSNVVIFVSSLYHHKLLWLLQIKTSSTTRTHTDKHCNWRVYDIRQLYLDMELDLLPEDCIAHILSGTSPQDACRAALTSPSMKDVANSDLIWKAFLPPDYQDIISRSTVPVSFTSKKELFKKLTSPLLIDGGTKVWNCRFLKTYRLLRSIGIKF